MSVSNWILNFVLNKNTHLSMTHGNLCFMQLSLEVSDEATTWQICFFFMGFECNKMFSSIKCLRRNIYLMRNHNLLKLISTMTARHEIFHQIYCKLTHLRSLEPLTWNIHITAIHRPSMAIMWLIHFGNICPFICPWVVALHSSLKKKKDEREEKKRMVLVESRSRHN